MRIINLILIMSILLVVSSGCGGFGKDEDPDPDIDFDSRKISFPNCYSQVDKPITSYEKIVYDECQAIKVTLRGGVSVPIKTIQVALAGDYGYEDASCFYKNIEMGYQTNVSPGTTLVIEYTVKQIWAKGTVYQKTFGNKETIADYKVLQDVKLQDTSGTELLCP